MRGLNLWIVILGLLFTSCTKNSSYNGSSVGSEKSYKTIQRPSSKNVQKFKRVALVIGNNDYDEAPLTNAITDARAMRDFLKSKEFKVIYSENAREQTMRAKVDTFLDSLDDESIGFVYYSGHGIQEYSNKEKRVTNYLIPIDNAKFKRKIDLDYSAISLNYLLDVLSDKQNGLNIVMVDACRSPFKAFSRSTHNGLAPSNAKGVYIAYATAYGEKTLDDGLFRKSFIKYASQPLKLIDIFEKVKVDVYGQNRQTPFISNGKRGSFYFVEPIPKVAITHKTVSLEKSIVEEVDIEDEPKKLISHGFQYYLKSALLNQSKRVQKIYSLNSNHALWVGHARNLHILISSLNNPKYNPLHKNLYRDEINKYMHLLHNGMDINEDSDKLVFLELSLTKAYFGLIDLIIEDNNISQKPSVEKIFSAMVSENIKKLLNNIIN